MDDLTPDQIKSLVNALEADLLVRPRRGNRLAKELLENQQAIETLRYWAKWSNEYAEICNLTGKSRSSSLGRLFKKANKENRVHHQARGLILMTNEQMIHVNNVIESLKPKHKQIIHWQYIKVMTIKSKLASLAISNRTYYNRLDKAHDAFIIGGGLL